MSERLRPSIFAQWQGRRLPVQWPRQRPAPEPGDIVRLDVDGRPLWRSFRVVGRHDRLAAGGDPARVAIDLDVEPVPDVG